MKLTFFLVAPDAQPAAITAKHFADAASGAAAPPVTFGAQEVRNDSASLASAKAAAVVKLRAMKVGAAVSMCAALRAPAAAGDATASSPVTLVQLDAGANKTRTLLQAGLRDGAVVFLVSEAASAAMAPALVEAATAMDGLIGGGDTAASAAAGDLGGASPGSKRPRSGGDDNKVAASPVTNAPPSTAAATSAASAQRSSAPSAAGGAAVAGGDDAASASSYEDIDDDDDDDVDDDDEYEDGDGDDADPDDGGYFDEEGEEIDLSEFLGEMLDEAPEVHAAGRLNNLLVAGCRAVAGNLEGLSATAGSSGSGSAIDAAPVAIAAGFPAPEAAVIRPFVAAHDGAAAIIPLHPDHDAHADDRDGDAGADGDIVYLLPGQRKAYLYVLEHADASLPLLLPIYAVAGSYRSSLEAAEARAVGIATGGAGDGGSGGAHPQHPAGGLSKVQWGPVVALLRAQHPTLMQHLVASADEAVVMFERMQMAEVGEAAAADEAAAALGVQGRGIGGRGAGPVPNAVPNAVPNVSAEDEETLVSLVENFIAELLELCDIATHRLDAQAGDVPTFFRALLRLTVVGSDAVVRRLRPADAPLTLADVENIRTLPCPPVSQSAEAELAAASAAGGASEVRPLTPEDEARVATLLELGGGGWTREACVNAYLRNGRNVERAANSLFEGGA